MQRSILVWLVLLALGIAGGPALAQMEMLKDVVASGGGRSDNGTHKLVATVGQPCVGKMTTTSYQHYIGFLAPGVVLVSAVEEGAPLPEWALLEQNYPNPFHSMTTIRFDLPDSRHVRLEVYSMDGRRVATLIDRELAPGRLTLMWDGRDLAGRRLPSGAYIYRLTAGDFRANRRMLLMK